MATTRTQKGPCSPARAANVRFMTDEEVPSNAGVSVPGDESLLGGRHLNAFVRRNQKASGEPVEGVVTVWGRLVS